MKIVLAPATTQQPIPLQARTMDTIFDSVFRRIPTVLLTSSSNALERGKGLVNWNMQTTMMNKVLIADRPVYLQLRTTLSSLFRCFQLASTTSWTT
ncbi:hypothetical protein PI125_g13644 [Phytophthora idaei]|nr:hypothetical protein PI125_g13644 [Phytophthora idaei]